MTKNNMQLDVTVDTVNLLLRDLSKNKDRKNAIRSGLRKGLSIIRKQTIANLKATYPGVAPLKKGIKISLRKDSSAGRVDIFGNKAAAAGSKDYKTFVLRFFNAGTKQRVNRKDANRGQIRGSEFFDKAIVSTKDKAIRAVNGFIIQYIEKKKAKYAKAKM